jgi:hypothetical protein
MTRGAGTPVYIDAKHCRIVTNGAARCNEIPSDRGNPDFAVQFAS